MIGDAIRQAQRMHRAVIEATYDGTCQIYEKRAVKDLITKVTSQNEVMLDSNIPCHLSFSNASAAAGSGTTTAAAQTIKLFMAPERDVPPGCKIEVTQQGRTESYCRSGKAAVYSSHQEILLDIWKGYA